MEIHPDSKFSLCDNSELPEPHRLYSLKAQIQTMDLVFEILDHYKNRPTALPGECFNKIYMTGVVLGPEEFERQSNHYKRWALQYRKDDPISCLYSISEDMFTPEINERYWKIKPRSDAEIFQSRQGTFNPSSDMDLNPRPKKNPGSEPIPLNLPKQYLPPEIYWEKNQKTIPSPISKRKEKRPSKRGILWVPDPRWKYLWPSSQKIFFELMRRTQQAKKPNNFPWCQAGLKSLMKFTGYSQPQVRRALGQLQNLSFIKRIVRGYEDRGASKYFVFLTPQMSGAFRRKSSLNKKSVILKRSHRGRGSPYREDDPHRG